MKNMAWSGLLLVLASAPSAKAFDPFSRFLSEVEEGNQLYRNQHFDQALEQYEQAEQTLSQEPRIHFNRGNALFKMGHAKEAREAFLRSTGTEDPEIKKKIYYNIGNTYLSEGGFHDAISYYRRALEIDPALDDARFNMEMALQAIKQQQQQQKDQSQKQDDSKKDEKEQEDQKQDEQKKDKEQEKKDNPKDDQKKEDSQKDQQTDQNNQQQEQQKQQSQEQEKSSGQDQQEKQNGKEEQKKQQPQQDQPDNQQNGQKKNEPQQGEQAGSEQPLPLKAEEISPEQFRDMLKAIQENEKAFQMYRFELPEFNQEKSVDKDW